MNFMKKDKERFALKYFMKKDRERFALKSKDELYEEG